MKQKKHVDNIRTGMKQKCSNREVIYLYTEYSEIEKYEMITYKKNSVKRIFGMLQARGSESVKFMEYIKHSNMV